jgi:hypothetical protein
MQKFILLLVLFLLNLSTFCQEKKEQPSGNPYKFCIGLGAGISQYRITGNGNYSYQSSTVMDDVYENINLHADYSFVRRFSAGIAFENNGLVSKNISSDNVSSFNLCIVFKYKFINKDHNHLFFQLSPVYSSLAYRYDIGIASAQEPGGYFSEYYVRIKSRGFGIKAALGWDHFFGKHLGIFLLSGLTILNYSNLEYPPPPIGYNSFPQPSELKCNSVGLNLGMLYRF